MVDWLPTLLNRSVTKFDGLLHMVDWLPTLLNRFVTKFDGLLHMVERHQTIVNQVCYEVFFIVYRTKRVVYQSLSKRLVNTL